MIPVKLVSLSDWSSFGKRGFVVVLIIIIIIIIIINQEWKHQE